MKRIIICAVCVICGLSANAQKKIYIPEDLRGMDLKADTSKWSFKRSVETDDLIFMWERGFGQDTFNPPMLEGKPMAFNLNNLIDCVQSFYTFFRDTLAFIPPQRGEEVGGGCPPCHNRGSAPDTDAAPRVDSRSGVRR